MGGALTDGAYKLFPAYASLTGVKGDAVKWEYGDLRLREAMLLKGDVDAILGFDSTMYFGLVTQGITPARHQVPVLRRCRHGHLRQRDRGVEEGAGESGRGEGLRQCGGEGLARRAGQSAAAIAALKKKNPLTDEKLEMEKLQWLIKNQIVTPESKADGLGGVRADRMDKSVVPAKAFARPARRRPPTSSPANTSPADVRKIPWNLGTPS